MNSESLRSEVSDCRHRSVGATVCLTQTDRQVGHMTTRFLIHRFVVLCESLFLNVCYARCVRVMLFHLIIFMNYLDLRPTKWDVLLKCTKVGNFKSTYRKVKPLGIVRCLGGSISLLCQCPSVCCEAGLAG